MVSLRQWLRHLRISSGQSQQQIADLLGITRQYYQQIEAGDRQHKMDIILSGKLAELFNITINEIADNEKKFRNGVNDEKENKYRS